MACKKEGKREAVEDILFYLCPSIFLSLYSSISVCFSVIFSLSFSPFFILSLSLFLPLIFVNSKKSTKSILRGSKNSQSFYALDNRQWTQSVYLCTSPSVCDSFSFSPLHLQLAVDSIRLICTAMPQLCHSL